MLNDPGHPDHRAFVTALKESRSVPGGPTVVVSQDPYVASHVHGGVWMGGVPPIRNSTAQYFDCLVLSAREFQAPMAYAGLQVATAEIDDCGGPFTIDEAKQAVRAAGKVMSWTREGLRVLVTCFEGRNRSGLISAIALCRGYGMSPESAIASIRKARGPHALSNKQFVKFILEYCSVRR